MSDELLLVELDEHVFGLVGEDGRANSGFVVGDQSVLLVDAQACERLGLEVARAIASVTPLPVGSIVYTHHHGDHIFGAQVWPDATVLAHPRCSAILGRYARAPRSSEFLSSDEVLEIFVGRRAARAISADAGHPIAKRLAGADYAAVTLVVPGPLDLSEAGDRQQIDLGGTEVEIEYLGLGHGDDDVVVWAAGGRVLFAGDLGFVDRIPAVASTYIEGWRSITDAMCELPAETVVLPGHGPVSEPEGLESQRAYLSELLHVVRPTPGSSPSFDRFESIPGFDRWHEINLALANGDR